MSFTLGGGEVADMYLCPHCSQSFSRRYNLNRHLDRLHKADDDNTHTNLDGQRYKETKVDTESRDDDESGDGCDSEEEMDRESEEETHESSSCTDDEDLFSRDAEDLESDASVTSSEDEDEECEDEECEDEKCEDEDEECKDENTIRLQWPNHKYWLSSVWRKYGEGKFKLIEHRFWLDDFELLSAPRILRKVRRATDSEFEALCEIAENLLSGNVYMLKVQRPYLQKNRNLIRALARTTISLNRKRRLVLERGAEFVESLIECARPLFTSVNGM